MEGLVPFARLQCLFDRHRPKRSGVEWDGSSFVGTCKRCGAPIRRRERGGWRKTSQKNANLPKFL